MMDKVPPPKAVIPFPFLPLGAVRAARAQVLVNSAWNLDLSGEWEFCYHPQVPQSFPKWQPGLEKIAVPSHFCLLNPGQWGAPIYTNLVYPIPVVAPAVPDENPTGDHFTSFAVPAAVLEEVKAGGELELIIEGAESLAEIWVNDTWVGTSQGSRLRLGFSITELVRQGKLKTESNRLAVRVVQWSAGTYLEDQDQWWIPGLFREIRLEHLPAQGLRDVQVEADLQPDGTGILKLSALPTAARPGAALPDNLQVRARIPELGWEKRLDIAQFWADKHAVAGDFENQAIADKCLVSKCGEPELPAVGLVASLGKVQAWSAERPYLYDLQVECAGHELHLRVGFRHVEVRDGVLLANGKPLKINGVNRHEIRAEAGRVFSADFARADLELMKAHNINAIRTSHYPPHPRFLDLCDEIGLWVMDECDLETHGYELLGWVGNPTEDPAWGAAIKDRMRRMVARDRNHACIFAWSLGNESHTGENLAASAQLIRELDTSRIIHYEGDYQAEYTDVYARMYPSLESMDAVLKIKTGPLASPGHPAAAVSPQTAARIRTMPYLLVEYAHAMGTGPGGVADYAQRIWESPRCMGGFVWEWRDHALMDPKRPGQLQYGGDFGEILHDANFVCDGLVDANSRPSSGLWDWAVQLAPVALELDTCGIRVQNRHAERDLAGMKIRWRVGLDPDNGGEIELGRILPGESWTLPLAMENLNEPLLVAVIDSEIPGVQPPAGLPLAAGKAGQIFGPVGTQVAGGRVLTLRAFNTAVPAQRADVLNSCALNLVPVCADPSKAESGFVLSADGAKLINPAFGLELPIDFSVWRAPTDNDNGHNSMEYWEELPNLENLGAGTGKWCASAAERWRAAGLERAQMRTVDCGVDPLDPNTVIVQRRIEIPGCSHGLDLEMRISALASLPTGLGKGLAKQACQLQVEVHPFGQWPLVVPRLGWIWPVSVPQQEVEFCALGPGLSYADLKSASWLDNFQAPWWGLTEPTITPQEAGNREDLHSLQLDIAGRPWGVEVFSAASFGISGWSDSCLEKTAHHHELPAVGEQLWLHVDLGMQGIGSRSCGPDVRPPAQLRCLERSLRIVIWTS